MLTIYRCHLMFQGAKFDCWYPRQNEEKGFNIQDFGRSSMEGGDIRSIGNGTVAIGRSCPFLRDGIQVAAAGGKRWMP